MAPRTRVQDFGQVGNVSRTIYNMTKPVLYKSHDKPYAYKNVASTFSNYHCMVEIKIREYSEAGVSGLQLSV